MDFKNIGTALRWLRTRSQQKQREVAELAGITPAMLSAYETGKHRPSLDTTERLLRALECDVIDLTDTLQLVTAQRHGFSDSRAGDRGGSDGEGYAAPEPVEAPPAIQRRFQALVRTALRSSDLTSEEEDVLVSILPGMLRLIRHLKA